MTILVACGLQREAKILGSPGMIAVAGGGDAARLEAMLEAQAGRAVMIVSSGIAGALDPALKAGDVVIDFMPLPFRGGVGVGAVPKRVGLDETESPHPNPVLPPFVPSGGRDCGSTPEGERLRAALPHAHFGLIIGQDHIAVTIAEKAALAATGALAVDMETHIAARVAARHGLPFMAIRTISDTAHETLPPAALVGMNPDGSMALGKVLMSLARRPGQLPALIRTGKSAEAAFKSLAEVHRTIVPLWPALLT